jgi:hypothetical protein
VSRREAAELGLPIEVPPDAVEELLLGYHDELRSDLQLLEQFDPTAVVAAAQAQAQPQQPAQQQATGVPQPGTTIAMPSPPVAQPPTTVTVRLERALRETSATTDAFVTRGIVSQQPEVVMPTGMPAGSGPLAPTLEVRSEGWEELP